MGASKGKQTGRKPPERYMSDRDVETPERGVHTPRAADRCDAGAVKAAAAPRTQCTCADPHTSRPPCPTVPAPAGVGRHAPSAGRPCASAAGTELRPEAPTQVTAGGAARKPSPSRSGCGRVRHQLPQVVNPLKHGNCCRLTTVRRRKHPYVVARLRWRARPAVTRSRTKAGEPVKRTTCRPGPRVRRTPLRHQWLWRRRPRRQGGNCSDRPRVLRAPRVAWRR